MPYKDPEKLRAYKLAWQKKRYAESPEVRAVAAEKQRRNAQNPESALYKYRHSAEFLESERQRNRERWKDSSVRWEHRVRYVKRRYGLTREQYIGMLETQSYMCAICGKKLEVERHHVDHCHTTGRVRGILCQLCNTGIGHLKDSIELLRSALRYLEAFEPPPPTKDPDDVDPAWLREEVQRCLKKM